MGRRRRSARSGSVIVTLAAAATLVVVAVAVTFVVGMRTKSPTVQRAVRRMNKAFWNPRAMETAGSPGAYASVVHHVGRRSGTTYRTPIVPVRTDDGFVIALPYGDRADWVQNVLDAGRATLTHDGETHLVDRPELVPTHEVDSWFGASERRAHRTLDVDRCLRVHLVEPAGA